MYFTSLIAVTVCNRTKTSKLSLQPSVLLFNTVFLVCVTVLLMCPPYFCLTDALIICIREYVCTEICLDQILNDICQKGNSFPSAAHLNVATGMAYLW